MQHALSIGGRQLDLSTPVVMGIMNVTPDSFSDGSALGALHGASFKVDVEKALKLAQSMITEGASIIDVGGESTRPGATPVSEAEELDRVIPVIEAINNHFQTNISVDTSSPAVMREAVKAGAVMFNDVRALRRQGALEAASQFNAAICLMHTSAEPDAMQSRVNYADVVEEIYAFLKETVQNTINAGIAKERLVVDPGFGFGKTVEQNFKLLCNLATFKKLGLPILAGVSRKSMIGQVTNKPVEQRLAGSLAATCHAIRNGASIIRCHDVAATVDLIRINTAVEKAETKENA